MNGVVYATRWRLLYLDGRQLDELPMGSPILERWPDPVELHLTNIAGEPVQKVEIPRGAKPIFYRNRSLSQEIGGDFGETRTDATVFGYARESGSNVDCKLWMWRKGEAITCPPEHFAQGAIEMQLR